MWMSDDSEEDKEYDIDMYPSYTKNIRIEVSDACPYKSKFEECVNTRDKLELERDFETALKYYKQIKELYILYSASPVEVRDRYTTVNVGHGYRWNFPSGREIEMHDLGFEYMCCLQSLLIYIVQRMTLASTLSEINSMIKTGIPILNDMNGMVVLMGTVRNTYLPLELKSPTIAAMMSIFITYSLTSTFFNTAMDIEIPETMKEDELRRISSANFDTLVGIYQGVYVTKNMAYRGWKEVQRAGIGIYIDTLNNIDKRLIEMKQFLIFLSFFNDKIFCITRTKELNLAINDVTKLISTEDYIMAPHMSRIIEILLELSNNDKMTNKVSISIEVSSERAGVARNLSEYIEKYNIEPIIVL